MDLEQATDAGPPVHGRLRDGGLPRDPVALEPGHPERLEARESEPLRLALRLTRWTPSSAPTSSYRHSFERLSFERLR